MRFLLILNHIQNARQSLQSNRLRSLLTMVGIMIGVASVTTILALSGGASKIVNDQVDDLGGNIAVVRPGTSTDPEIGDITGIDGGRQYTASTLTEADVAVISNLPTVAAVAPVIVLGGAVAGEEPAPVDTPIVASTPGLADVSNLVIQDGQFLDAELYENTAVIGPQLAVDIFGTEAAIGRTVTIRGEAFTVIGILKRINMPINYNQVNFDRAVVINQSSAERINNGVTQIQQINIKSTSVDDLAGTITAANKALLRTHLGQADFSVLSGDQISQPTSQLFFLIAGVTTAIAGISLLVGGIGIMNIMLVSVAERTREIGIRKAVGASAGDIVLQFLIESLALSIGGGILGYLLGYGLAFGLSLFLTFDPVLTWQIAATAFVISVVIGTIFGLYPAIRAARKDPVQALRQYE